MVTFASLLLVSPYSVQIASRWKQSLKRAGIKHLSNAIMLKRLKELYQQYKPYVRVDLVMYGVLLLLIVLYFIYSLIVD